MKSISNLIRSITRALSYGSRLRPTRDWLVLLSLFTLLLIASVGWNLIQFTRVAQGEKIGNVEATAPAQIQVGTVQDLFKKRAEERVRFQSQYRFVDPSL